MKKNNFLLAMLILFIGVLCFIGCKKDEDGMDNDPCDNIMATYNADVIEVLSVTCSYEACHVANSTFGQLDFNVFSNLKPFLDNGSFEKRVLNGGDEENKVMPPPYTPEGKPMELTAAQLEIITCWKDAGYPEG